MKALRLVVLSLLALSLALPALAAPEVSRRAFARDVVAREPVDPAESFPADVGRVYCFTQVSGIGAPTEIVHLWKHGGVVYSEIRLAVEGSSYRTWSWKTVSPEMKGEWTVEVTDAEGNVLSTASFTVSP